MSNAAEFRNDLAPPDPFKPANYPALPFYWSSPLFRNSPNYWLSSVFSGRIVSSMSTRVHSRRAHQLRRPRPMPIGQRSSPRTRDACDSSGRLDADCFPRSRGARSALLLTF